MTPADGSGAFGHSRIKRTGMRFGSPHRHYRVTDSTNSRARELVEAGAPGGTVVTAREQTAGRGRVGRVWTAPEGKALLYSAILRPLDERHLLLPLSVPLAVCAAAEALRPGISCQVKWPNDVWLEGRKLVRHPDRGQAAGRLGRDRRRPEPLHCSGRVPRRPPSTGDFALRLARGEPWEGVRRRLPAVVRRPLSRLPTPRPLRRGSPRLPQPLR